MCVFCQIIAGQVPARLVYQDEQVVAFHDIRPAAPVHILIVPRRHIDSLNALDENDAPLLAHMIFVARQLAYEQGIGENGYRLVINTGAGGGQSIFHLHLHLLGGRSLSPHMSGRMAD